jgi:hypothetical protein
MKEVYFDTNVYDLLDELLQTKVFAPVAKLKRQFSLLYSLRAGLVGGPRPFLLYLRYWMSQRRTSRFSLENLS